MRLHLRRQLVQKAGMITIENPPAGEGWMAGGGYALAEFASKEAAIADAKNRLEIMGDGVLELIQVSEMHPPPQRAPQPAGSPALPGGVIPYLTIDGASEASAF